jgi:hypothetical protein
VRTKNDRKRTPSCRKVRAKQCSGPRNLPVVSVCNRTFVVRKSVNGQYFDGIEAMACEYESNA